LLKEFDERGFVFYTNLNSQKGQQLKDHPSASLCFYWMPMERQIRIKGTVERVDDAQADAYFASRPRNSQIGAWASKQSQAIESPLEFEKRIARKLAKYSLGKVPRPDFWSGFRVVPTTYEFWEDRPFRLHERWHFHLETDGVWHKQKLFP
jgi:pyridoxamine 5'-phosphate oxidase